MHQVHTERLLSQKQVLEVVPFTRAYIHRLEVAGKFPSRRHVPGGTKCFWLESEIQRWIAELATGPSAGGGACLTAKRKGA